MLWLQLVKYITCLYNVIWRARSKDIHYTLLRLTLLLLVIVAAILVLCVLERICFFSGFAGDI